MTKNKTKRCLECGTGRVRPHRVAGRFTRYKTMANLEIPKHVAIPTCNKCGAEWLDAKTARELDQALDVAFRKELRSRAVVALERITKHLSQRSLESLLGLSQGYLSKLRAGDRDPSSGLVSQLALISRDPKKRIRELMVYWESKRDES